MSHGASWSNATPRSKAHSGRVRSGQQGRTFGEVSLLEEAISFNAVLKPWVLWRLNSASRAFLPCCRASDRIARCATSARS